LEPGNVRGPAVSRFLQFEARRARLDVIADQKRLRGLDLAIFND